MSFAKGSGSVRGRAFRREYNPFTDRYCRECGEIIFNQGIQRLARCPKQLCGAPLRFHSADVTPDLGNSSMRLCGQCAAYIHTDDTFCGVCKWASSDAITRKRRQAQAQAQQERLRTKITIRELQQALKKEKEEHKKLKEDFKSQDDEHMDSITEAMLLDDNAFAESAAAGQPQEKDKEPEDGNKENGNQGSTT